MPLIPFKGWYPGYKGAPPAGAGEPVDITEEEYKALKAPAIPAITPEEYQMTAEEMAGGATGQTAYTERIAALRAKTTTASLESIRTDVFGNLASFKAGTVNREQLIEDLVKKYGESARSIVVDTVYKELRSPEKGEPEYVAPPGTTYAAGSDAARRAEEEAKAREAADYAKQLESQNQQIATLTNAQQIAALQADLASLGIDIDLSTGAMTKKPALPTYESDFAALRAEHGLEAIETRMNQLKQDIRSLEASARQGIYDEEGKLRPMELIGTRQRELQRQAQEQIDTVNRSLSVLTDEYNTKMNLISTTMNLKQMDYETAKASYDQDFNRAISMLNYIEGKTTEEEQDATRQRDDARANLTLLSNLIIGSGKTWDTLDAATQATITDLEIKAELPSGIYSTFLNQKPEAELLGTFSGYDESGRQSVSFIYKDKDGMPGIVKTVSTSVVKPPTATELAEGEREKQWAAVEQLIDDNPGASYDDLYAEAKRYATKLSDSDIKTILQSKGVKVSAYNEEERAVMRKIYEFQDDWKAGGKRKAGTRQELIDDLAKSAKYLTYDEVKERVDMFITDQWLEAFRPKFLGIF